MKGEDRRWCEWCRVEPIPGRSRATRVTCSSACKRGRARARAAGFEGDRTAWRRYLAGQLTWQPGMGERVTPTSDADNGGAS